MQSLCTLQLVMGITTLFGTALAFHVRHPCMANPAAVGGRRNFPAPLNMCICINCARVTDCQAYHFVETKHEQPHMNEKPEFMPRDGSPTIHVNVRSHRNNQELKRLWSEHKEETEQAEANAADDETELHGDTVYDLSPSTTVEYDVVECADFVEDKGCWVRNMPEEIRQANPDFVPT